MLKAHSLKPNPEKRFPPMGGEDAISALHTPRQNRLLAALPEEDYERLLPELEFVPLPLGLSVHGAGDREKYLYFVTEGIVSRFYMTENGATAESALAGREGVIGIAAFLGGERSPSQAVVLSAGHAYRVEVDRLKSEFKHCGPLQHVLLLYTQALITQIAQTAVCNRHHSVEQQLCRWLLLCLDRLTSNRLDMIQELIANMLGVRREGVTEAAGHLQAAGLIHYCRGHITVLDRPKLEQRVCECYAVVRKEMDRLLPDKITN